MTGWLTLLVRVAAAVAGLAFMAFTVALAAGVLMAVMVRSAWRGLRGHPAARVARERTPERHAAPAGLGAREAVVDVVARGRP